MKRWGVWTLSLSAGAFIAWLCATSCTKSEQPDSEASAGSESSRGQSVKASGQGLNASSGPPSSLPRPVATSDSSTEHLSRGISATTPEDRELLASISKRTGKPAPDAVRVLIKEANRGASRQELESNARVWLKGDAALLPTLQWIDKRFGSTEVSPPTLTLGSDGGLDPSRTRAGRIQPSR